MGCISTYSIIRIIIEYVEIYISTYSHMIIHQNGLSCVEIKANNETGLLSHSVRYKVIRVDCSQAERCRIDELCRATFETVIR